MKIDLIQNTSRYKWCKSYPKGANLKSASLTQILTALTQIWAALHDKNGKNSALFFTTKTVPNVGLRLLELININRELNLKHWNDKKFNSIC